MSASENTYVKSVPTGRNTLNRRLVTLTLAVPPHLPKVGHVDEELI